MLPAWMLQPSSTYGAGDGGETDEDEIGQEEEEAAVVVQGGVLHSGEGSVQ